jgi:nitrogen regulatory protein PII
MGRHGQELAASSSGLRQKDAFRREVADVRQPAFRPRHASCHPSPASDHGAAFAQGAAMKKLDLIIRPHKLDEVRDALTDIGVQGMTVTEVKGFGRQKGKTETYRGSEYTVTFLPKVRLEVLVADAQLEQVMKVASDAARTGKIGDGKIMVTDLVDVMRIRTGETGDAAI